ncbi:MAG: hypothetical protein ACTS3F_00330 [Phycisphaerales bacterium]
MTTPRHNRNNNTRAKRLSQRCAAALALALLLIPIARASSNAGSNSNTNSNTTPLQSHLHWFRPAPPDTQPIYIISPSLASLDRDSTQLMRAMQLTTTSTLAQVLSIIGMRAGIELDAPFAAAFDPTSTPPAFALILSTRNADRLEQDLRARPHPGEPDAPDTNPPILAFEFSAQPLIAQRLTPTTLAIASDTNALKRFIQPPQPPQPPTNPPADALPAPFDSLTPSALNAAEATPIAFITTPSALTALANAPQLAILAPTQDPILLTCAPGPLGLRLDAYLNDTAPRDAEPTPPDPIDPARTPLNTLRRQDALLAAQIISEHPYWQRHRTHLAERLATQPPDHPAAQPLAQLINATAAIQRAALIVHAPHPLALTTLTPRALLRATTIHWHSPDPAADTARIVEALEALTNATPGKQARFTFNPEALAAADRTLRSWAMLLPEARLAAFDLAWLDASPLSPAPAADRAQPLTLRGDLSWPESTARPTIPAALETPAAATFIRPSADAIADHRPALAQESYDNDPILAQVRTFLPEPRIAEAYLELKPLLTAAMPILEQQDLAFPLPTVIPPAALAIAPAPDHLRIAAFIPTIALRPLSAIALQRLETAAAAHTPQPQRQPQVQP